MDKPIKHNPNIGLREMRNILKKYKVTRNLSFILMSHRKLKRNENKALIEILIRIVERQNKND
jgi:hypothetical protein